MFTVGELAALEVLEALEQRGEEHPSCGNEAANALKQNPTYTGNRL